MSKHFEMSEGNVSGDAKIRKSLDPNTYATKKTISHGLLNIALLTANASQLKYVLHLGSKYEFYELMLALVGISFALQILQAVLCVILGVSLDLNNEEDHPKADRANNIILCLNGIIMAVNVVINSFDMRDSNSVIPL